MAHLRKDNSKRERWVEEMMRNGLQRRKAAEAIGHKRGPAAEKFGWLYSKDPWCVAELARRQVAALEKAKIEADEVILSAARQIRFDPRKLVNGRGKPKGLHTLDDDTALAISAVEIGDLKVRVDRGTAREQLMKHMGLFKEDNAQQAPGTLVHAPGMRTVVFAPIPKTRKG